MKIVGVASSSGSTSYENEDEMLRRIATGKALLFIGSGFSRGAKNINSSALPIAQQLAEDLSRIAGFEPDTDLRYVADRLISEGKSTEVVAQLKRTFSVSELSAHHTEIAGVEWRRVYTTNYDHTFEMAAAKIGKYVEPVGIGDPPDEKLGREQICVHINGSILSLDEDALNSTFKLSSSSYIASDSFLTSRWLYPFRQDLERASAIIFVGYSLYDIEIQKILFENEEYKKKTYFICSPSEPEKSRFIMSRFGDVVNIGSEAFGDLLENRLSEFKHPESVPFLTAIERYVSDDSTPDIRDSDIETFLMKGEIENSLIDAAIRGPQRAPYLVIRQQVGQIRRLLNRGNNIVITSDFGNGKSLVAKTLAASLTADGFEVYELVDSEDDYIRDLDTLVATGGTKYLIIDRYDHALQLIDHHANFGMSAVRLILVARTSDHEKARSRLDSSGLKYSEVSVDNLSDEEAERFVDIIDNLGVWGDDAALSRERKISKIVGDDKAHIASILVSIFQAPQIQARLSSMTKPLLQNPMFQSTVFAIAFLEYTSFPLSCNLVSKVAGTDSIYTSELRSNANFRQLFRLEGSNIKTRSSVFGLLLITSCFTAPQIVEQLLKIATALGSTRGETHPIPALAKCLFRFSVIERLLPGRIKRDSLVRYYETVKLSVPWLVTEPHFWVQYAMALLTYTEYDRAQRMLDQAYALAAKKDNYHTHPIDNQQARLFFLQCIATANPAQAAIFFEKGDSLISKSPNDIHKYRQLAHYRDIFDTKYNEFPPRPKSGFERSCGRILMELEKAKASETPTSRGSWLLNDQVRVFTDLVRKIKSKNSA